jgi:hypothetical protein
METNDENSLESFIARFRRFTGVFTADFRLGVCISERRRDLFHTFTYDATGERHPRFRGRRPPGRRLYFLIGARSGRANFKNSK